MLPCGGSSFLNLCAILERQGRWRWASLQCAVGFCLFLKKYKKMSGLGESCWPSFWQLAIRMFLFIKPLLSWGSSVSVCAFRKTKEMGESLYDSLLDRSPSLRGTTGQIC